MENGERQRQPARHACGKRGRRGRERGTGFTLVELLVVVAVIALMAALLFPALVQARARARKSACASNLSQIVRAGMLYLQDYDERFPSCYPTEGPPYLADHRFLLHPYLKSWDLFYCPERQTVRAECLDPEHDFSPGARCMGYGYNWGSGLFWYESFAKGDGLVRSVPETPWPVGVGLSEVAEPAHCLFFGDTNDYDFVTLFRPSMPGAASARPSSASSGGLRYEPPRHSGGNNFAFVDGHVQWLPFPGGRCSDGGPWVVPDMSMYSRTSRWEMQPIP
jgi:prepilin-type processing-associated H-X9-DG protein/prepilin-type N-terminal cleavage/methylation domain-containing protein